MLAYTQRRGQVLSSTVPAHRLCQTSLVDFTFCGAGLQPDEGPSALKYRACAQNVPDVTHRFYILRCCPTHRPKVKCSQVPCLRTESVRHHLYFFTFWDAALHPDKGTSALKYRARAQNVSSVTTILSFWDAGAHHDEGSSTLQHRACAQNVSHALKRYHSNRCPQL